MNYELAKELKDAGFPQTDEPNICGHCGDGGPDTEVRYPTLSELIEACGDRFASLIRKNGGWESNSKFLSNKDGTVDAHNWIGSTPEEAVTRLWLALNKSND